VYHIYEFLSRYQLTRDIGAQYEYSNLGVGLLGHVLARRAGKSYEALVQERILTPLHMEHKAITLTPWMREHRALPPFAGAGALCSTMTDMLIFARANLTASGGRLQSVMQRTHEARTPAG